MKQQYKTAAEIEIDNLEGTDFHELMLLQQTHCLGQINDMLLEMLEIMREKNDRHKRAVDIELKTLQEKLDANEKQMDRQRQVFKYMREGKEKK